MGGAGKTTTLGVLTGEVRPPTRGEVTIFGHDLSTGPGLQQAYQALGVCPQVDPLWQPLSAKDHLMFFGRIKGVREADLCRRVDALLRRLGLDQADATKPASSYSGGMKRKLSMGIALIGHSPLMFLDEPSAAVDAGAKRHLWKVIKMRGLDQTVVLTTHSMEEAEALCDRIAIQVKGQLRCLGPPNHIRQKYGSGYQLEMFCEPHEAPAPGLSFSQVRPSQNVIDFVHSRLSVEATLLEFHGDRYLFQLPPMGGGGGTLNLGRLFTEMLLNSESVGVSEYSVTRPSLEQVFLRFAREQEESEEDAHVAEPGAGTAANPSGR